MSEESKSQNKKDNSPSSSSQKDDPIRNAHAQEEADTDQVLRDIEKMTPAKRKAVFSAIQYSGPLPPAEQLQAYEEILPGAADRIIKMAEDQAFHRRTQEEKMVNSSCGDSRLGLWLGFTIGLCALVLSGTIAIFADTTLGSLLGFVSITSLVGVFVYGSRQKRQASEEGKDKSPRK